MCDCFEQSRFPLCINGVSGPCGDPLWGKYDIPKEHRAVKVDPAIFERYIGLYEVASGKTVKIWREGNRLMQEAPTGAVFELIPESETTFFTQFIDATFAFAGDENGKATAFIVSEAVAIPRLFEG